jgi:hypothetical protein
MQARFLLLLAAALAMDACTTVNPLVVAPATVNAASVMSTNSVPPSADFGGQVLAVPADDELSIEGDGVRKLVRLDSMTLPPAASPQAEDARRILERALLFRQVTVTYLHGGHWNPLNWFGAMPANVYTADAGVDVRAYLYVGGAATPDLVVVENKAGK